MKLSIICKNSDWHIERLHESAVKLGLETEIRDIHSPSETDDLGDVVLWRSSSLGRGELRTEAMRKIAKNRVLINDCLAYHPLGANKIYQEKHIRKNAPLVNTIPTFVFSDITELRRSVDLHELRFPFIQKPAVGSKGEGIVLIQNENDFFKINTTQGVLYQNFIENTGDYRILLFAGKILGVIKRSAQNGNFLNNLSQGGTAVVVDDAEVLQELYFIATTVASVFGLMLCGVDVIYDRKNKKFFFLEVNTVPQWKGFQSVTGIDVAQEIILHIIRLENRKNTSLFQTVLHEYESGLKFLWDKKFHFLSRMYLWTKNPIYKRELDILRASYIGSSAEEYEKKIVAILKATPVHDRRMTAKKQRELLFRKYPMLDRYTLVLFKCLFAESIYNVNLRLIIRRFIKVDNLLALKQELENDFHAIKTLSTHAINYLSMIENFLEDKSTGADPIRFLEIGKTYNYKEDGVDFLALQIYFFTHCIIGASQFYHRAIAKKDMNVYHEMLFLTDKIIDSSYDSISLDNKFEFLVCCRMCNYGSINDKRIEVEATNSLHKIGNYFIDTHNSKASPDSKNDFLHSEHRNVLYLMSKTAYHTYSS